MYGHDDNVTTGRNRVCQHLRSRHVCWRWDSWLH
jgi:hypothetical protein